MDRKEFAFLVKAGNVEMSAAKCWAVAGDFEKELEAVVAVEKAAKAAPAKVEAPKVEKKDEKSIDPKAETFGDSPKPLSKPLI